MSYLHYHYSDRGYKRIKSFEQHLLIEPSKQDETLFTFVLLASLHIDPLCQFQKDQDLVHCCELQLPVQ